MWGASLPPSMPAPPGPPDTCLSPHGRPQGLRLTFRLMSAIKTTARILTQTQLPGNYHSDVPSNPSQSRPRFPPPHPATPRGQPASYPGPSQGCVGSGTGSGSPGPAPGAEGSRPEVGRKREHVQPITGRGQPGGQGGESRAHASFQLGNVSDPFVPEERK